MNVTQRTHENLENHRALPSVWIGLKATVRRLGSPEAQIVLGGLLFIAVLWVSGYLEPDIRWLHFFQTWIYIAAVWLSMRNNRWGYFIGFSAAGFWNYITLCVNSFFHSGLHWLFTWISTGELKRMNQIVAVPGWIGNLLIVTGCAWAYTRLPDKRWTDLGRLLLAFVLTTSFFAMAMAVSQPRYLPLFRRALHPHWP